MLNEKDHPEPAALSDYASGRLDDARCTDIDRHLAECDACCDLLDRLGSGHVEELLHALQSEVDLPSFDAVTPAPQLDLTDIPVGESRYELKTEIGAGGMGIVYEAFDKQLQRSVAIKTLKPGNDADSMRERFIREALITGRLNHPGVPSTHELGTLHDGRPFMALRLVRGRNLASWLAEHRSTAAPDAASLNALLSAFGRLCDCVASAHADGVIHRDIKPANVMVGEFGEVQLMDWGLARRSETKRSETKRSEAKRSEAAHSNVADSSHAPSDSESAPADSPADIYSTSSGTVMGTLGYMSPEQARGDRRRTGPASDVFALGAVLCEILTGRPPFAHADKAELTRATRSGDLGELHTRLQSSTADTALTALMLRCLDADPTLRPATAELVAAEFSAWQASVARRLEDARLAQAQSETRVREERKRRRIQLALLAGSVLFAATVWRLVDHNRNQKAAFDAKQQQQLFADRATAAADLDSFRVTLTKAVNSEQQHDPLWKEADFYLERAARTANTVNEQELHARISSARQTRADARSMADADWKLLAGMEQMASNSRVARAPAGELRFIDGVGEDNTNRPLADPAQPERRPARDNGIQRRGTQNSRIATDRAHRAVAAFSDYGLSFRVVTAAEAAAVISQRPAAFQQALFPHIEIWLHYAILGQHEARTWVAELINLLDADAYRVSLRGAMLENDVETLLLEAINPAFPQQPPELVWSLATQVRHRAPRVASELLSLAHLNHLDSTIIMWDLSRDMQMSGRRSEAALLLLARAALETDPVLRSKALVNIGHTYGRNGETKKLIMVLRQAIELNPGSFEEMQFLKDLSSLDNTAFELQTLTEMLNSGSLMHPEAWVRLGDLHFDSQNWQQAHAAYQHAHDAFRPADQHIVAERLTLCELMLADTPANTPVTPGSAPKS